MFGQPYLVGPYVGATTASLFWMSVNYVRYNYDHNYKPRDDDVGGHDRSRDFDDRSRDVDVDDRRE